MKPRLHRSLLLPALAATLLALPASSGGSLRSFSVPLAPRGDCIPGSAGAVVPLGPEAFLLLAEGPDGAPTTADDVVLLHRGLSGGNPSVTPLATPFGSKYSGRISRLSATRVVMFSAGNDGNWKTNDDALLLLDQLGSGNVVTPLVVGGLIDRDSSSPIPLTESSALAASAGADLEFKTADDVIILIQGLGSTNTITRLPAPFLTADGRTRPVILGPTSALVSNNGPDGAARTADDQIYLFTNLGTANTRTTLATPRLHGNGSGRAVSVNASRAVVASTGPDGKDSTVDDVLFLLDDLGGANSVQPIPIGSILNFGAGQATVMNPTTLIIGTNGADAADLTADDSVAIITGLGTTNTITRVILGGLDEDAQCRPTRLSPTSCAFATAGPDFKSETADDEVVVMSGVGTMNTVRRIAVPGLAEGITSQVVAVSSTEVILATGGPGGTVSAGGDDRLVVLRNLFGTPFAEFVSMDTHCVDDYGFPSVPAPLGVGRAVAVTTGPDGAAATGNDDQLVVVEGLSTARGIRVDRLAIKFRAARPANASTTVSGQFELDDLSLFSGTDLVVSVGNAVQRLPAALLLVSRTGQLTYTAPRGSTGWVKTLKLDPIRRTFSITGKGVGVGLSTVNPGYIPVAIEAPGDLYLADAVAGTAGRNGISFRRR